MSPQGYSSQGCCGTVELVAFPYTKDNRNPKYYPADLTKYLLEYEKKNFSTKGFAYLTLNSDQIIVCHDEVIAAGYTPIGPWRNPSSGKQVTFYYKILNQ